jgi:RNA polymerase sigma factor (sigma-70 family)
MPEANDHELLAQFARENSEAAESAFAALVGRHVALVYSVAMRRTGNPHAAEEITQAVFIILARKAKNLSAKTILSGWLHETTRLTAANYLRAEIRRRKHEQEAFMQTILTQSAHDETWQQLAPYLDEAISKLRAKDRDALILRYFENKNLREVGDALGLEERAAQKRVNRAVEKLRTYFSKRGIGLTAAVVAGVISAHSVQAAPIGLAKTISVVAIAKGSMAAASTITLVKGTMKMMTWMKIKFALGTSIAILIVGGVATIGLSQNQPTVYSFLENPPIISDGTFEREINTKTFPANIPPDARKQSFSFALDGENYRMDFGGGMTGKFGDVYWQMVGNQLIRFDSKLNKINGNSGGITGVSSVGKMSINFMMTFGITAAQPKNIAWKSDHKKMTFETDGGEKYAVDFEEKNNLPVSATIRYSSTDQIDGFVAYRYEPDFFEGQLPVEIIRYSNNTTNENFKTFTIRIKSLKISNGHLSADILDPEKFIPITNPNYTSMFFSNNISYWTDAKGKSQRVLTIEENEKEIERIKANQEGK